MKYTSTGRGQYLILFLWLALALFSGCVVAQDAADATAESAEGATSGESAADEAPPVKPKVEEEEEEPAYLAAEPETWGSYYDPQQEFCGKFDCYSILGFDYENFKPDTKEITKRYRRVSRKWHPDKSKHPKAKERFVKIVRAYEVLTNVEKRKEYDFMRYNQEAYYQKYGTSVIWTFAPKSDVTVIALALFFLLNAFSWFAQKNKWQNVADRLVKAALEEWSPSQGGSPESKELREHALAIWAEKEKENEAASETTNGEDKNSPGKKAKKAKKVPGKEKKKLEIENLTPILKELVNEMDDFGGGFHKPTWKDLMVVNLAKLPYKLAIGTAWEAKYYFRRLQGKELDEEEKEVLTERAVGPVAWDIASEEDREEMIKRELWIMSNLVEWKEEQEIKNLSAWERKQIMKAQKAEKKKGKQL